MNEDKNTKFTSIEKKNTPKINIDKGTVIVAIVGYIVALIIMLIFHIPFVYSCQIAGIILVTIGIIVLLIFLIKTYIKTKNMGYLATFCGIILILISAFTPYRAWLLPVSAILTAVVARLLFSFEQLKTGKYINTAGKNKKLYKVCPYCSEKMLLSETECPKCKRELK